MAIWGDMKPLNTPHYARILLQHFLQAVQTFGKDQSVV
jgi:hypothetical protein